MNRIPPLLFSLLLAACPKDDAPPGTTSTSVDSSSTSGTSSSGSDTGAMTFEKGLTEGPTSTVGDSSSTGWTAPDLSSGSSTGASDTSGGFEHTCWPACDSDQDCDLGYICDMVPGTEQRVCAAPCVEELPGLFACGLEPSSCQRLMPLSQCLPGSVTGGPMCFPIVCVSDTCIAGKCVNGLCY